MPTATPQNLSVASSLPSTDASPSFSSLESRRVIGHRTAVTEVAWNSDGTRLLAAGDSSGVTSVLVFDTSRLETNSYSEQRHLHELRGHSKKVSALLGSPTSPHMLATASIDCILNVYDTRVGTRPVQAFTFPSACLYADWASDGNTIGVGLTSNTVSFIDCLSWAVRTDKEKTFETDVYQFRWAPDGRRILFGRRDGYAELFEWPSLEMVINFRGNVANCLTVAFDPKSRYFAVASLDTTVSVWDAHSITNLFSIDRWEFPLRHVAYSYDGRYLAIAGDFDRIDLTDVDEGSHLHSITTPSFVTSIAWHPSRPLLAYSPDKGGRDRYNTSESGPPICVWGFTRSK